MPKRSLAPQRGFFPQPAYLIGTFKDDGAPNFALITWITFCAADPPVLMFASRGRKLTRELVERNGVFSANLVTADMMELADYCGNISGYDRDKGREAGVGYLRGAVLDVPVLEDSPWVHECSLVNTIHCHDGMIYLGVIKNTMVDEGIRDTSYGKVDLLEIDPLIYAPGGYYRLGGRVGSVGDGKKLCGDGEAKQPRFIVAGRMSPRRNDGSDLSSPSR